MKYEAPIFIIDQIYYDINSLLISSSILFIFSFLFGKIIFKSYISTFFVAFVKTIFYLIFFLIYFNKTNFNFSDSKSYLEGTLFLYENYSFFGMLFDTRQIVLPISGGNPFYYFWSYISFLLFGPYVHSPIILNILSTFLGAYYVLKISKKYFYFTQKGSVILAIIYSLHWEVVPWSSFFNLRDILIQVNILAIIYYTLKILNKFSIIVMIKIIISILILRYLRNYLIYIFFLVFLVLIFQNFLSKKDKKFLFLFKLFLIISLFTILTIFYLDKYINFFLNWIARFDFNYGIEILKFFLSPLPVISTLSQGYGFLIFGSFINLITFPLLLLGIVYSFKKNNLNALIVFIFFTLIVFVHGIYGTFQGPRVRLMIVPLILIYNAIAIRYLLHLRKNYD